MFNRITTRLVQSSDTPLAICPQGDVPVPLTSLTITATDATACTLAFAATPLGDDDRLWVWGCVCESPGVYYIENRLRLIVISAKAQATAYDICTELEARFGPLQLGQTVWIQCQVFSSTTGLISSPFRSSALVVAAV